MKATQLCIAVSIILFSNKVLAASPSDSLAAEQRFRIGLDVLKPFSPFLKTDEDLARPFKMEVLGTYKMGRVFYINLDIGYGKGSRRSYENVLFSTGSGFYARTGFDINTLAKRGEFNRRFELLVGYRFALSKYKEQNEYTFKSRFWETQYMEEESVARIEHWQEALLTFRMNFRRTQKVGFSLGSTLRTKVKLWNVDQPRMYIPGFGQNNYAGLAVNIDLAVTF